MGYHELLLSSQLCFRVYSLERKILAVYKPHLDRLGLTYPQYLVMLVLWEKREATIGQICLALGLDTGTVSPLVKRMERAGLVTRTRPVRDERTVVVSLTEDGAALEEMAREVPLALGSSLCGGQDGIDEKQYEQLRDALDDALARLGSP